MHRADPSDFDTIEKLVDAADQACADLPLLQSELGAKVREDFVRRKGLEGQQVFDRMADAEAPPGATRAVIRLLTAAEAYRAGHGAAARAWSEGFRHLSTRCGWMSDDLVFLQDMLGCVAMPGVTDGERRLDALLAERPVGMDWVRDLAASCMVLSLTPRQDSLKRVAGREVHRESVERVEHLLAGRVPSSTIQPVPVRDVLRAMYVAAQRTNDWTPGSPLDAFLASMLDMPLASFFCDWRPESRNRTQRFECLELRYIALSFLGRRAVQNSLASCLAREFTPRDVPPGWLTSCNRTIVLHMSAALVASRLTPHVHSLLGLSPHTGFGH